MVIQVVRTELLTAETTKMSDTYHNNNNNAATSAGSSKPHVKQRKIVRSTSLERIRKFNTYICSQNYFILPALLAWLKKPHDKLHASVERFIANLKCIVFTSFLPRLACRLLLVAVHLCTECVQQQVEHARDFADSVAFMRLAVYAALASVFAQLVACLYCLSGVFLPAGFLFMCTCLYLISQMNYNCLLFVLNENAHKSSAPTIGSSGNGSQRPVKKRLSRKDLLGQRTISNMNLL